MCCLSGAQDPGTRGDQAPEKSQQGFQCTKGEVEAWSQGISSKYKEPPGAVGGRQSSYLCHESHRGRGGQG